MTLALDLPPCPDSPVRRLDPRWKLAALLLAVLSIALLRGLSAAGLALAGSLLLALLGRLPARWFLRRLGATLLFLSLFALPLPLLIDEGPAWQLGPLRLSLGGACLALLLITKALAILTLTLVLLATAPFDATLKAAHALRVPGLLVQLAVLSYRYVFVAADELARLRIALRVRGYRNRADRHSYRTVGHVAGTLLVRSYERAERVGQAMRCRGFDGHFRSLAEFATRPADVGAFLLITSAALSILIGDWWWR